MSQHRLKNLAGILAAGLLLLAGAARGEIQANVMTELTFTAARTYADPFNQVKLDVVFADPQGKLLRVPGFWDGGNVWKVRYASPVTGIHAYRTECSETTDRGLHGMTGELQISPYSGDNPLYLHGPLRVARDQRHLEHVDGTPFFWLGDTWWMGLSARLHFPDEFQQLAADRKAKGFTVVQIVAGLYPDMFPFDPRGVNEAGHPWTTNYSTIRPEYFDAADRRLEYLVSQGLTPCIVGAWGYFLPWMGREKMEAHWRYLIARYGALPVVWCAAGEANLPWYLAADFPYDDRKQVSGWTDVMRYLRETDPFHRLVTSHPTGIGRLSARHVTDDPALLDFDFLQTPHGRPHDRGGAVVPTVETVRASYADRPVMPVIDGEDAYEMLGDNLPTKWPRRMFWLCLMNGAAGHTYGANGIWQCNRPGDPHGNSPHGGTYGKIPWNEAMRLPGSAQVGYAKSLLMLYRWEKFEPHPEWAAFAPRKPTALDAAKWIWFPGGDPTNDVPAGKVVFRRVFVLPQGTVRDAVLRVAAEDAFAASLNGVLLGGTNDWRAGREFTNLLRQLQPGTNILSITAENLPFTKLNPAGLIAVLEIQPTHGKTLKIVTDATWECTRATDAWTSASVVAPYGGGPWGKFDQPDNDLTGPQSAGIPGGVRFTYAPEPRPLVLSHLKPGAKYLAAIFDPVTGTQKVIGKISANRAGRWTCPPPADCDHDWVLILEDDHTR